MFWKVIFSKFIYIIYINKLRIYISENYITYNMDKSESNKNDFFLRIQYAFPILYEKVCLYFINIYLLLFIIFIL